MDGGCLSSSRVTSGGGGGGGGSGGTRTRGYGYRLVNALMLLVGWWWWSNHLLQCLSCIVSRSNRAMSEVHRHGPESGT